MEPLLKWPGSKRKLVGRLAKLFNEVQPRSVFEPFSGAATLSLHFEVETAYINDINLALINFYQLVSSGHQFDMSGLSLEKHLYYQFRSELNDIITDPLFQTNEAAKMRAAKLFYYINHHGFNGLIRMNKSGRFSTPIGDKKRLIEPVGLEAFSQVTAKWKFTNECYSDLSKFNADVNFIDPPYLNCFTQYSTQKHPIQFQHLQAQIQLLDWQESLPGITIATNGLNRELVRAYRHRGFRVFSIEMPRSVSCKSDGRKPVLEMLAIKGFPKGCHVSRLIEGATPI